MIKHGLFFKEIDIFFKAFFLVPCFWWHVFLQPCRRCDFRAHRTWKVYDWGGGRVGWGGIITSMHARLRNYVMLRWWNVLARWQLHAVLRCWHGGGGVGWDNNVHARLRNYVMLRWWNVLARWQLHAVLRCLFSTCVVNGLGRCECGAERKLQEPNKLIVVGTISKKIAPVKWRTALAQQSMLGSGIESINGSIATTWPSET